MVLRREIYPTISAECLIICDSRVVGGECSRQIWVANGAVYRASTYSVAGVPYSLRASIIGGQS